MIRVRTARQCVKKRNIVVKNVFLFGLITMKAMNEFQPSPWQAGRSHKIGVP
jgi:hypothetical protein